MLYKNKTKYFKLKRKDFILIIFYFNQKKGSITFDFEKREREKEIENILNVPPPKVNFSNIKKTIK